MKFGSESNPVRILPESGRDRLLEDEDEENFGSRPVVPQPGPAQSRPVSSTSASEELARLFATAKLDLRDQLKMPHERFPLSHLNWNFWIEPIVLLRVINCYVQRTTQIRYFFCLVIINPRWNCNVSQNTANLNKYKNCLQSRSYTYFQFRPNILVSVPKSPCQERLGHFIMSWMFQAAEAL